MNRTEEIDPLVADAAGKIAALGDAAMEEIRQKQAEADEKVSRHAEAAAELAGIEHEIVRLEAGRESLPDRAYRAGLDEDFDLEDELKTRYRNLGLALEDLSARGDALRSEVEGIEGRRTPGHDRHPNDATIRQYAEVGRVAHARRRELEDLRDRLTEALDAAVDPVAGIHETTTALTRQLGHDREWSRREVVA